MSTVTTVAFIKNKQGGIDISYREDGKYGIRTWKQDGFGMIVSAPAWVLNEDELVILMGRIGDHLESKHDLDAGLESLLEAEGKT